MTEIKVKNEELRTTREAMRELNALLDQLEQGDVEKIVLTSRGKIRGVLLSPKFYSENLIIPGELQLGQIPCDECGLPTKQVGTTKGGTWIHKCPRGHDTYIGK